MRDKNFLTCLHFTADLLQLLSYFSKDLQRYGTTVIGSYEKKKSLIQKLNRLKEINGDYLDHLFEKLDVELDFDGNLVNLKLEN